MVEMIHMKILILIGLFLYSISVEATFLLLWLLPESRQTSWLPLTMMVYCFSSGMNLPLVEGVRYSTSPLDLDSGLAGDAGEKGKTSPNMWSLPLQRYSQ